MSLTRQERERASNLADAVYHLVFRMLDAEPDIPGDAAGRIATATEKAFLKAYSAPGVSLCHPQATIPAPER